MGALSTINGTGLSEFAKIWNNSSPFSAQSPFVCPERSLTLISPVPISSILSVIELSTLENSPLVFDQRD